MLILAHLSTKTSVNILLVRDPLLMFSPGSRPSDIQNTFKDLHWIISKDKCENVNLLVQDIRNGSNIKRDSADK